HCSAPVLRALRALRAALAPRAQVALRAVVAPRAAVAPRASAADAALRRASADQTIAARARDGAAGPESPPPPLQFAAASGLSPTARAMCRHPSLAPPRSATNNWAIWQPAEPPSALGPAFLFSVAAARPAVALRRGSGVSVGV